MSWLSHTDEHSLPESEQQTLVRRQKRSRREITIIVGAHNRLGLQEPSHTIMVFSVRLTWCDERVIYCRQHHPKISFLEPSQWFLHLFTGDTTSLFNQVDRRQIGLRPDSWWALLLRKALVFIKYISGIDRKETNIESMGCLASCWEHKRFSIRHML